MGAGLADLRSQFEATLQVRIREALHIPSNQPLSVAYKILGIPPAENLPLAELHDRAVAYKANLPTKVLCWLHKAYPSANFQVYRGDESVTHIRWQGSPTSREVQIYLRTLILDNRLPNVEWDFEHQDKEPSSARHAESGNGPGKYPRAARGDIEAAYKILGLSPGASPQEIKTAYHHAAQMYHPDKVAGLAPEFRELADSKMKEINAAYEELTRTSGRDLPKDENTAATREPTQESVAPNRPEKEVPQTENTFRGSEAPPRKAKMWLAFAGLQLIIGRTSKSIECCLNAIRLDPGFSNAWGFLGNRYMGAGQFGNAIRALNETIRLNPGDSTAWADLGETYLRKGEPNRAVQMYEAALRLGAPGGSLQQRLWESRLKLARGICLGGKSPYSPPSV